jgi:hypothetical protein
MVKKYGAMTSIAVSLGVLASMLIGTPAQAAQHCGAQKTVLVSIHYRACSDTVSGGVKVFGDIQNNHGSAVTLFWQAGYSFAGGAPSEILGFQETVAAGKHPVKAQQPSPNRCITARLVVRVYNPNNSTWGPWSYDSERSWPC